MLNFVENLAQLKWPYYVQVKFFEQRAIYLFCKAMTPLTTSVVFVFKFYIPIPGCDFALASAEASMRSVNFKEWLCCNIHKWITYACRPHLEVSNRQTHLTRILARCILFTHIYTIFMSLNYASALTINLSDLNKIRYCVCLMWLVNFNFSKICVHQRRGNYI